MSVPSRIYRFGIVSAAFMLLISCGYSTDNPRTPPKIQTIAWEPDGNGFVQYLTNDAQYYGSSNFITYSQTNEPQMSTVAAVVEKKSGSPSSSYGIVFCLQDNDNLYLLLITTNGYYCVYEKVGGMYSAIIPWTVSPLLKHGVRVENEISVTEQTLNHFTVYFNGSFETTFSDGNFPGGTAGFYASVSPTTEHFPSTPEDVRCKLSSPVAYP